VALFLDDTGVEWEAQLTGRALTTVSLIGKGGQFRRVQSDSGEWIYYGSIATDADLDLAPRQDLLQSLNAARETNKLFSLPADVLNRPITARSQIIHGFRSPAAPGSRRDPKASVSLSFVI
jgi:hypothetical protein